MGTFFQKFMESLVATHQLLLNFFKYSTIRKYNVGAFFLIKKNSFTVQL